MMHGRLEVELNDSSVDFLPEYFATSDASVEGSLTLRSGLVLEFGRVSGADGHGYCWGVRLGRRVLLGNTPRTLSLEAVASWVGALDIREGAEGGLRVHAPAKAWSQDRVASVAVPLWLSSGQPLLLDVRPAYRQAKTTQSGMSVAGGTLSRVSDPGSPAFLMLSAPDFVAYMLPSREVDLDEVAEFGAAVELEAVG